MKKLILAGGNAGSGSKDALPYFIKCAQITPGRGERVGTPDLRNASYSSGKSLLVE